MLNVQYKVPALQNCMFQGRIYDFIKWSRPSRLFPNQSTQPYTNSLAAERSEIYVCHTLCRNKP